MFRLIVYGWKSRCKNRNEYWYICLNSTCSRRLQNLVRTSHEIWHQASSMIYKRLAYLFMKRKVTITFVVLGLLLVVIAGSPQGNTSYAGIGGTIFLLGALAYNARREQTIKRSKKWLAFEVASLIIIIFSTWRGYVTGLWYAHPISFFVAPLAVLIAWVIAFLSNKPAKSTSP